MKINLQTRTFEFNFLFNKIFLNLKFTSFAIMFGSQKRSHKRWYTYVIMVHTTQLAPSFLNYEKTIFRFFSVQNFVIGVFLQAFKHK